MVDHSQFGSSDFDRIIQTLEHHNAHLRVKKLLFCLSHRRWENNLTELNREPIADLVRQTVHQHPTLKHLRSVLFSIVATLNKRLEYRLIANLVLGQLSNFYQETREWNQLFDYQTIAHQLARKIDHEQMTDILRVACRLELPGDRPPASSVELLTLVQEIHILSPAAEQLLENLICAVQLLNQPEAYTHARGIIVGLQPLYGVQITSLTPSLTSTARDRDENHPSTTAIQVEPEEKPPSSCQSSIPQPSNPQPPNPQSSSPQPPTGLDSFELRLEIMRYTNPLRAKIVIFSALYQPFNFNSEDWSMLRTHTLNALLEKLCKTYVSFEKLEQKLLETTQLLRDPEESLQSAAVILRVIQGYALALGRFPPSSLKTIEIDKLGALSPIPTTPIG